ncbi:hypothetical protein [Streptomyces mobaraensis]|uniref:DUF4232 domain-containing protein n=1 Tax=Streptomyces mobaraensis TaxID=35621 RepID=A0A5N5WFV7_STRMB|nr:hypothetical protein [Streptomyces mobaraensis]KAB7851224.1 hypothetical protein FRZ00_03650 [Streptomyces mobaraensis]
MGLASAVPPAAATPPAAPLAAVLEGGGAHCTARPQNPHWSSGAADRRILFKTRVSCSGTYPAVSVRIDGQLLRGPLVGPKALVAVSSGEQTVRGGKVATFYTPLAGAKQVSAPGWYTGVIRGRIIAPQPRNLDDGHTQTVLLE